LPEWLETDTSEAGGFDQSGNFNGTLIHRQNNFQKHNYENEINKNDSRILQNENEKTSPSTSPPTTSDQNNETAGTEIGTGGENSASGSKKVHFVTHGKSLYKKKVLKLTVKQNNRTI
jgi:hypothetical protein